MSFDKGPFLVGARYFIGDTELRGVSSASWSEPQIVAGNGRTGPVPYEIDASRERQYPSRLSFRGTIRLTASSSRQLWRFLDRLEAEERVPPAARRLVGPRLLRWLRESPEQRRRRQERNRAKKQRQRCSR